LLIVVKISKDIVNAIQNKKHNVDLADEILNVEREFDVTLKRLHPGINNTDLSTYFTIDVPNSSNARSIITHLQRCKGIEAAYVKPQDDLANAANK
jgi:hypothetical protein